MQIAYKDMIKIIKQVEKFEKSAANKSQLEKNVHLQLALQSLSRTCDSWSKNFTEMAHLINEGLIKSVLRDDSTEAK